jgi:hypothetical protein
VTDSITVEEFSRDPDSLIDPASGCHRSLIDAKDGREVADEWRSAGRLP